MASLQDRLLLLINFGQEMRSKLATILTLVAINSVKIVGISLPTSYLFFFSSNFMPKLLD